MTFELYWRKARAGVLLDDALLVHHCRLRAIDLGRQLVRGGQRKRDALDPRNYHQRRLEILRLDGLADEDGELPGEEQGDLVIGLSEGLADDPSAKQRRWGLSPGRRSRRGRHSPTRRTAGPPPTSSPPGPA